MKTTKAFCTTCQEATEQRDDTCYLTCECGTQNSLLNTLKVKPLQPNQSENPNSSNNSSSSKEPILIKAGSNLIRLGPDCKFPPQVDCRVVAEDYYQKLIKKSEVASNIQQLIEMWKFRRSGDVAFQIPDEAFLELEILKSKYE